MPHEGCKVFIPFIQRFLKTWWNRILKNKKVDEELKSLGQERGMDTGWSIGNLFRGVPFEFVKKVAQVSRKKFDQEGVLVLDHSNNKTYYVD